MIGVAFTVHNRNETARLCIEKTKALSRGLKIIVVDDASTVPYEGADYRFEENVGISKAKNKCLELLEDCEHIFLFDDDVHPKREGWYESYVNSKQPHLCFTFQTGSTQIGELKNVEGEVLQVNKQVRGCMMYLHRSVLEKVGGFDETFIRYGWEHIEYSCRIYAAGLTANRFMDVQNSRSLFHSLDYERKTNSSVSGNQRYFELNNKLKWHKHYNDARFVPYKNNPQLPPVVLTAYFTLQPDPQRGEKWSKTARGLDPLIESVKKHGVKTVIFYDSIDQPDINERECELVEFIRIPPFNDYCTNTFRRIIFHEYLKYRKHKEVFMVDATDVEMLKNPFGKLKKGAIYCGNEELKKVDNMWMRQNQEPLLKIPDYREVIGSNNNETLLNAGIIGGKREIVLEFLEKNTDIHKEYSRGLTKTTDMAVFNYTIWKYFKGKTISGSMVNTPFKKEEYNDTSWFKHK